MFFYNPVLKLIIVITYFFFLASIYEHGTTLHTCLAARQNNFLKSPEINLLPPTVVQVWSVVYLIDFIFHLSGDMNTQVGSVSMQNKMLSIWRVTSVTVPSSHGENWEPAKTNEERKMLWNGGRRGQRRRFSRVLLMIWCRKLIPKCVLACYEDFVLFCAVLFVCIMCRTVYLIFFFFYSMVGIEKCIKHQNFQYTRLLLACVKFYC